MPVFFSDYLIVHACFAIIRNIVFPRRSITPAPHDTVSLRIRRRHMNFGKHNTEDKQKQLSSRKSKYAGKAKITTLRIVILALLGCCIAACIVVFGMIRSVIKDAPSISAADVKPTNYTSFVVDQSGNELERFVAADSNRIWRSIDQIPEYTQNAFVAIEDSRFYEHNGIDLQGIARAFVQGVTHGLNFSQGASTITQQLIKNTIFTDFMNETSKERIERKIQEQYLALQLEKIMSKQEILENYLNTINLGQNTLGIQTASMRYFGKDVSQLTLSESACIAAITQNPSKYNPITHPEDNNERRTKVLNNMLEQGMISQEDYDVALADDVYARIQSTNASIEAIDTSYTYYIDELTEQVIQDLQDIKGYTYTQAYNLLYSGGITVVACQDQNIQQIVDEEINNPKYYVTGTTYSMSYALTITHADGSVENLDQDSLLAHMQSKYGAGYALSYSNTDQVQSAVDEYKADIVTEGDQVAESLTAVPEPQASIVIMDQYTGEVKAISGGRGTKSGSLTLNRATNTTRQPGSCFKVLSTYAPALDAKNYTLASTIEDSPFNYSNGRPVNNWYSGYRGTVTVRTAIRDSMNVVTVKVLTDITPKLGYDYLLKFGFTTLVDNYVTDSGAVYSDVQQALALGGITKGITNLEITAAYATIANDGIYTKPRFYTQILDHDGNVLIDNTAETKRVLKDSTAGLLTNAMEDVVTAGTGTRARLSSMPVSGKTGTTSDNVDIWFCGYTPYYTCSIWGGYDDNQQMSNTSWHLTLWAAIMSRVSAGQEYKDFTMPSDVHMQSICAKTGLLPVESCPTITEYFADDSMPDEYCSGHYVEPTTPETPETPDGTTDGTTDPSTNGDTGTDTGGGDGTDTGGDDTGGDSN